MASRIKSNPTKLFDCFLEVVRPMEDGSKEPWILQSFPTNYKEKEVHRIKSVSNFVFPCPVEITAVQNFSFVLTDTAAQWTFGFVRLAAAADTAIVFLSSLPWHDTFYRILNHVAELLSSSDQSKLWGFLEACYNVPRPPDPGTVFHVSWGAGLDFTCPVLPTYGLPTIPENRNLTEYFNAVGVETMLEVFASMLHERRIVITSRKLSRLSACVQAANSIIYPMFWQHIFIPVLPKQLMTYLSAPMPFLIGVPGQIIKHVRLDELGEVVILDADANKITSPFTDLQNIPQEVLSCFKRTLKSHENLLGDSLSRVFLRTVVHLIGGYREALRMPQGEKITFDEDKFVLSRSPNVQPFLRNMLQLQIFRQFVEDRLSLLNDGRGFSDEFEKEAVRFTETMALNSNARHKIKTIVRKEGGALVKAVKSKANPAVKQAVKSVKSGGKSAYKGMKSRVRETAASSYNLKVIGASSRLSTGTSANGLDLPRSAPASPKMSSSASRRIQLLDGDSSGSSSSNTNSSISSRPDASDGSVWSRANTELGFAPKVLKYERFDPPSVIDSKQGRSQRVKSVKSSPEMELLPPLNLDLMDDMKDVIYRKTTRLKSASNQNSQHARTADLINFDAGGTLRQEEEHEVIFDPFALSPTGEMKLINSSAVSHNPLPRSDRDRRQIMNESSPGAAHSVSSENLLQEYGLDFGKLSVASSRPVQNNPISNDPFADLDPLRNPQASFQNGRPLSVVASAPPHPTAPPRAKKKSLQPYPTPNNLQTNWTTFE